MDELLADNMPSKYLYQIHVSVFYNHSFDPAQINQYSIFRVARIFEYGCSSYVVLEMARENVFEDIYQADLVVECVRDFEEDVFEVDVLVCSVDFEEVAFEDVLVEYVSSVVDTNLVVVFDVA
jgi:hypothetical protein